MQELNWYKLDNAANLFPAASTVSATNVFRLSAHLFEEVSQPHLQKAAEMALEEMPSFNVHLCKGIFWYYFETNTALPKVEEEVNYPCGKIDKYTNNGFLFSITYFGRYIHIEFFHSLCDGTGALQFLTKIVTLYLQLKNSGNVVNNTKYDYGLYHHRSTRPSHRDDSFTRITRGDGTNKSESVVRKKAYRPSSTLTHNGEINVIKGIMSVSQLKAFAKSKNATITELLSAILIYSMYIENFMYEPKNASIDVCIPVNLRKFFPSYTLRNFFTSIAVGVNFYKQQYSLEQVIDIVKKQMKEEVIPQKLYAKVMYGVGFENNMVLRFLPLFAKNIGLKLSFGKGEKGYSMVFSNLGQFSLPVEMQPYVERFEFALSPTLNSRYKTAGCSYLDTYVHTISTNIENTEIQRRFFKILAKNGIDVTISCNDTEYPIPNTPLPLKEENKKRKKRGVL